MTAASRAGKSCTRAWAQGSWEAWTTPLWLALSHMPCRPNWGARNTSSKGSTRVAVLLSWWLSLAEQPLLPGRLLVTSLQGLEAAGALAVHSGNAWLASAGQDARYYSRLSQKLACSKLAWTRNCLWRGQVWINTDPEGKLTVKTTETASRRSCETAWQWCEAASVKQRADPVKQEQIPRASKLGPCRQVVLVVCVRVRNMC